MRTSLKAINPSKLQFCSRALDYIATKVDLYSDDLNQEVFESKINQYEIAIVRANTFIDGDKANNLKIICSHTTGLDHLKNIPATTKVLSLKGETSFLNQIVSTPEHTLGLILSLVKNITLSNFDTENLNWHPSKFICFEINNSNIGLIGFGRVARILTQYLRSLNAKISYYDPMVNTGDATKVASIRELFENNSIIVVCADLNETSINLINKNNLKYLLKGCYVINTSRGEIVNEIDLVQYLDNNTLAGYASDVVRHENNIERSILLRYKTNNPEKNIIITPHIAGMSKESIEKVDFFIFKKLEKELKRIGYSN